MKIQIDLLGKRADLISPKPVRVKLIWLKDDKNSKGKQNTYYERMFKIDTRMKGNNISKNNSYAQIKALS